MVYKKIDSESAIQSFAFQNTKIYSFPAQKNTLVIYHLLSVNKHFFHLQSAGESWLSANCLAPCRDYAMGGGERALLLLLRHGA